MSKKKGEAPVEKLTLGRFKHNLSIGIVGLPNVGKSTLHNILTQSSVPAENYPFCTVDPNVARASVPDARFDWLVEQCKPASVVSAFLEVTDIAGLVRGASQKIGLGNAFLSHIRAVDAIFHVVRIFDDAEITHVDGAIDPVRDLETISYELRMKDIEMAENQLTQLQGMTARGQHKELKHELEIMENVLEFLKTGKDIRANPDWKQVEIEVINQVMLLTAKPIVFILNMTERDFLRKKNRWLGKIKAWVDEHAPGSSIIPFSAAMEQRLNHEIPEKKDRTVWYNENGVGADTVDKVILAGYRTLGLVHFFTIGEDEVKCWTVKYGTRAPQAAGRIHTDFERGFICAEVMKYEDLHELENELAVKSAGKYRHEGRTYVVEDGDVIHFRFNVTASKKKK